MNQQQYESIFICAPTYPAEKINGIIEKIKSLITQNGGELTTVTEWGKRKLAYPISGHQEGIYTLLEFSVSPKVINNLQEIYRLNENIIRYLTIKKKKIKKFVSRKEKRAEKDRKGRKETEDSVLTGEVSSNGSADKVTGTK